MIPRFKPDLALPELSAALTPSGPSVERFESEFAAVFGAQHAVAFAYGRTALWALLKTLGIADAEIILPAYTCVVVAHAVVLSGNRCRFVDISLDDYNMDLDDVERAITPRTRAIVATHLFGYPLDCDRLAAIVNRAESRFGHRIFVLQDCAHSFGARWQGRLVTAEADAALFGLNISKLMTSIFGGMLTTDDAELAKKLRAYRQQECRSAGSMKALSRRLYLAASVVAFSSAVYPIVRWLEHDTSLLDRMTKAYHLDGIVHFPPDYRDLMTDVEARVGLVQLGKYPDIIAAHIANAEYYDSRLRGAVPWQLPPIAAGATYSHYVIRVPDRDTVVRRVLRRGIELGDLIQYSVPHMDAYRTAESDTQYPHSKLASQQTINLPVYAGLNEDQRERIASAVIDAATHTARERRAVAVG